MTKDTMRMCRAAIAAYDPNSTVTGSDKSRRVDAIILDGFDCSVFVETGRRWVEVEPTC